MAEVRLVSQVSLSALKLKMLSKAEIMASMTSDSALAMLLKSKNVLEKPKLAAFLKAEVLLRTYGTTCMAAAASKHLGYCRGAC
jgi:hypothetical protein